MARCKTLDLPVERMASSQESCNVIGGGGFGIHVSSYGIGIQIGGQPLGQQGHGHSHGGDQDHHGHPAYLWQQASHCDYQPPGLYRQGDHFHYVPGHYDLHGAGHWHDR